MEHKVINENMKSEKKKFIIQKKLWLILAIIIVVITFSYIFGKSFLSPPSNEHIITFDFDTGEPILVETQNLPLNQTSEGVTAFFSSTSDNSAGSAFSVQSYDTTFIKLSEFTGKYLYDNKPTKDVLIIRFSQQIKSITLTFATIEYRAGPSEITITAYKNSIENTQIGSSSASGTILNSLYPQGTLNFDSKDQPFNIVRIQLSPNSDVETTNFFIDNIKIKEK